MTSPAKTLTLTLSALALGVVIGQLATSAVSPRTRTAPPATEDLARLEARVDALARRPQRAASVFRGAVAPPTTTAALSAADEDTVAPPKPTQAELAGEIGNLLTLEPRDPTWSAIEEDAMRDALRTGPLAGARVVQLECRTSACRLVLDFADHDALRTVMTELPLHEAFAAGGFVHYTGTDDAPRTELFIARRGHTIPMPM